MQNLIFPDLNTNHYNDYVYNSRKEEEQESRDRSWIQRYFGFTYDNGNKIYGLMKIFEEEKEIDVIIGSNDYYKDCPKESRDEDTEDYPQLNQCWKFDEEKNSYCHKYSDIEICKDEFLNIFKLVEDKIKESGKYENYKINFFFMNETNEENSFVRPEILTRID